MVPAKDRLQTKIRAPRGSRLRAKGWSQEGALRMLMNNLDPEVAEKPQDLIVYGGTGKAARNWECFRAIVESLRKLGNDETLVVQSGKPVAVFKTHAEAPRVLISNAMIVPKWATWDEFRRLEAHGPDDVRPDDGRELDLYRHAGHPPGDLRDAGRRGPQAFRGIAQGEARPDRRPGRHGRGPAPGRDHERRRGDRRRGRPGPDPAATGDELRRYDDRESRRGPAAGRRGPAKGAAPLDRPARERRRRPARVRPPGDHSRRPDRPDLGPRRAQRLCAERPALRGGPEAEAGRSGGLYPRGPTRPWPPTSGPCSSSRRGEPGPSTTGTTSAARPRRPGSPTPSTSRGSFPNTSGRCSVSARGRSAGRRFPEGPRTSTRPTRPCSGNFRRTKPWPAGSARPGARSSSRGCRRASAGWATARRARFGAVINHLVRTGRISAPIVIGRDHLDTGSVASPNRETEGMRDGSDAIADWPILNALLNAVSGASWVSVHHGGGVGIGLSIHAGMVIVADGSARHGPAARARPDARTRARASPARRRGLSRGRRLRQGHGDQDPALEIIGPARRTSLPAGLPRSPRGLRENRHPSSPSPPCHILCPAVAL